MRKFLFFCFAILVSMSVWPVSVANSMSRVGVEQATNILPEGQLLAEKKRNKRPKKGKKKKFLGIFKRKSSCDCPKH